MFAIFKIGLSALCLGLIIGNVAGKGEIKSDTSREIILRAWKPSPPGEISISTDGTNLFDGEKTTRVSVPKMVNLPVIYAYAKVKAETEYVLEFFYKAEKVEPKNSVFSILICCNKANGANGSAGVIKINGDPLQIKNEWIKISKRFKTPLDTAIIQFMITFPMMSYEGNISDVNIIPVQNSFAVSQLKNDEKINIDGILDEPVWLNAGAMTPFFQNSAAADSMPQNKTEARLAFDDKMLYVAFKCDVKNIKDKKVQSKERDADTLWQDEGVEFFLMPSIDEGVHFIINKNGVFADYKIRSTTWENGNGYVQDAKWNPRAKVAVKAEKKSYCIEMALPLADAGMNIESLKNALVNFCRNDTENNENNTFSHLNGLFMNPKEFSVIKSAGGNLFVNRFVQAEDKNPYAVQRNTKLFSGLLSSRPGNYTVSSWACYGGLKSDLKGDKTLTESEMEKIQQQCIEEMSRGKECPLDTWAANFKFDLAKLRELYNKYGIRPMPTAETSGVARLAIERGAEILHPAASGACLKGTPSNISPEYGAAALEASAKAVARYKNEPYPLIFTGKDEHENGEKEKFSRTQNPDSKFVKEFDAKVKSTFGFGKYGIPDVKDPKSYEDPLKMRLSWIAFARAWTGEFRNQRERIYSELKKIKPDLKYIPMSFNTMGSMPAEDLSEYDTRIGDIISSDPYASSTSSCIRGKYNHGFATKLIKDITHLPEVMTVVQVFTYRGCNPSAEDVKEWVSQSLKMGATYIQYFDVEDYPNAFTKKSAVYKEIFNVNEKISKMNEIETPKDTEMAILYSLYSYMSDGPTDANEAYTAFVMLGENLHSWFKFVSDRDVEKGKADLKKYKLIVVPYLRFVTNKISDEILSALAAGTTVVFCDPRSFDYDIEGNSKAGIREKVFGVKRGNTCNYNRMAFTSMKGEFPLYRRCQFLSQKEDNVFSMELKDSSGLAVIAKYPDNSPAAVKGKYGKGTFYYFAANPLVSDILSGGNNWPDFFRTVLAENGIDMNCRIWDFHVDGK